jgi:putative ABC transport system permease protein
VGFWGVDVVIGWPLAAVLVLLTGAGALVVGFGGLGSWRPVATAAARAVAQLGAVSLVIVLVLRNGWLTAAFVVLMFGIATVTSARRIVKARHGRWAGAAIAAGVVPVLGLLLATRLVPLASSAAP